MRGSGDIDDVVRIARMEVASSVSPVGIRGSRPIRRRRRRRRRIPANPCSSIHARVGVDSSRGGGGSNRGALGCASRMEVDGGRVGVIRAIPADGGCIACGTVDEGRGA